MEILEHGVAAILALALYTIVDKIVVPLVSQRKGNGRHDNGGGRNGIQQNGRQDYINEDHRRRIDHIDRDMHLVRDALSDVRESVGIAKESLRRIEDDLTGRD